MRIQIITEIQEESLAFERYIRYCLEDFKPSISYYTYSDFQNNLTFAIRENPDLRIINSHFENREYPLPHLHDLGFEIARSPYKTQRTILVLYEKFEYELPEDWICFLNLPWCQTRLSERIKYLIEKEVIPTDEQIEELNRLYPPIRLDHHHHRHHRLGDN
ncbi:MAG: hypothetical protein ABIL40_08055 [candidate division WOR-3 bacterium]